MSAPRFDVVIVGAGIVGSACALECVRSGLKTAVIEANFAGGATHAGMGHIVVMDDSEPQFALTRYSQQLWDALAEDLPPEVQFQRTGTIWVAADEDEMEEVRRKSTDYSDRQVAVEVLDGRQLADAEPQLRPHLYGGLRVPGDSVIYPPCAAHYLLQQARKRGASLFSEAPAVILTGREVRLADGTLFSAGLTVNATGTWSPELTPGLAVRKRKGHLAITDRSPGFVRHQLVELGYLKSAHSVQADSVAFNVQPRANGQILIGSSRQFGAEDSQVEHELLEKMLRRACSYLPGLSRLSVLRTWTGFRAATPDKLPLIGPCPVPGRLFLATGHEGLGITTSLGTAKLLVDQILNRKSAIPREPYLPTRKAKGGIA